MDLKRYFRGPFVAVLVMLLLFFIVFTYANHGNTYTPKETSQIVSLINQGQVIATDLQKQGTNYDVSVPSGNSVLGVIIGFLPYVLIILFFFFLLNQMQGGGSRVMNFGKSKAKLITKDTPKTTFADVAGADEAIEELQEIKEFLQSPGKFQAIGAKIPKGVLLYGPPGT